MVKFIDVNYSASTSFFDITAAWREEIPSKGDCIFMQAFVFDIIKVESLAPGKCRITATTDTAFLNDMNELIDEWKGNEFFSGKNKETYLVLSNAAKLSQIMEVAKQTLPQSAIDYVKEHIEVCLALFPDPDTPPEQLTKIGGLPTAPKGFSFPVDKNGRSALFIAQLNLAELDLESIQGLPAGGMLYFFGTVVVQDEKYHSLGELLVRYEAEPADLEPAELPDDLGGYGVFFEKRLLPVAEVSLPPEGSVHESSWDLEEEEEEGYNNFREIVKEYGVFDPPGGQYYDSIRFMGHPQQVQSCVLLESLLNYSKLASYSSDEEQNEIPAIVSAFREDATSWRHLFSFSVDEFRDLSVFQGFQKFSDGIFNVLIKKTDLEKLDFSNVRTVYQQT